MAYWGVIEEVAAARSPEQGVQKGTAAVKPGRQTLTMAATELEEKIKVMQREAKLMLEEWSIEGEGWDH